MMLEMQVLAWNMQKRLMGFLELTLSAQYLNHIGRYIYSHEYVFRYKK